MFHNRKKYGKKFFFLFCLLICFLLAAGCGKNGQTAADPNKIVYITEVNKNLEFADSYIGESQILADSLYVLENVYDETTMQLSNSLKKVDVLTGEMETIPLFELSETEYIEGLTLGSDGNLAILISERAAETAVYKICEVSPQGEKMGEVDITGQTTLSGVQYLQNFTGDGQGNYYMAAYVEGDSQALFAFDESGAARAEIKIDGYLDGMFCTADGSLYVNVANDRGRVLLPVDLASGTLGAEITLEGFGYNGNTTSIPAGSTGLMLADMTGIFECDPDTGQCVKVIDWLECDIYANNVVGFGIAEEGKYWVINSLSGSGGNQNTIEFMLLARTTADKLPQKELLTFAALRLDTDMKSAVIRFNKTNQQYRIQVQEYNSDWATYMEDLARLNADLAGGSDIDIINLNDVKYSAFAAQGMLEDLYPYMEQDQDFNRSDYLENVLAAYESGDRLYGLMPSFGISALVGSAAKLQGIKSWNLEQLFAYADQYPQSQLLDETPINMMLLMLQADLTHFIDWETGTCSFSNEDFIRLLEYAATFEAGSQDWNDPDRMGIHEAFQNEKYLLLSYNLTAPSDLQLMKGMFDGPVEIVGFPVSEGSGVIIQPSNALGMSAQSGHKDGIWEFFSYLLTEEYQDSIALDRNWVLPVRKSTFDKICEQAMEEDYETDGNGNQIIVSNFTSGYDDLDVEIYASTEEEIAQFKEIIGRAQGIRDFDTQMFTIIQEESESFFAGQKSAAEVAEIIQSRMQIYVNENR